MIFEVTPEHIERLSDEDLRILVGYLSEQEAHRSGNSAVGVTYGGHQNAADGGIDVAVDLEHAISGYVPRQQTGFQSKAEDMTASDIAKEMRPGGKLRPSIRELGEKNGAYIIVSSKGSVAPPALAKRRNAMAAAIADEPSAASLVLDFYDRRRMATWVNTHPGLIPWVRARVGYPLSGWQPYTDWSSSPEGLDAGYLADDAVRLIDLRLKDEGKAGMQATAGVNRLREILSKPKGVARIVGLSGVGKTRLVQALFDSNVGSQALNPRHAVYTGEGDSPSPTPQELVSHLLNMAQPCVLIIDNCGSDLHQKLSARVRSPNSLISLVTIEHDISDDEPEHTDVFRLEAASSDIIEKIVHRHYPSLTSPELRTIAEFSEGNSRVALALANTAGDGASLANLNDDKLFERLFRQKKSEDAALLKAARALSLVYSFDGETLEAPNAELPTLAAIAGQTVEELHEHIEELRARKLIQRRGKWRALLPHALAHRLAKNYLRSMLPANPSTLEQTLLNDTTPERLQRSFTKRLGYLHDSERVHELVKRWMNKGGWLHDVSTFDKLRMKAFENLAPVDPESALMAIEIAVTSDPHFTSIDNPHGDRIVRLLRSLAYEEGLFRRACSLIASFVVPAREDSSANEALSVYKSLFHLYLSGTLASPDTRASYLRSEFDSGDARKQLLAQNGLEAMLEETIGSSYDFEFGARKRGFGYLPKTGADVHRWHELAFELAKHIANSSPANLTKVKTLIARSFPEVARVIGPNQKLIELAEWLASNGGWPEGWAAARSAARRLRDPSGTEEEPAFRMLADKLKPQNLEERITSYVISSGQSMVDLADLEIEDESKYQEASKQVAQACNEIGRDLAQSPDDLKKFLPELLASDAQRVWDVAVGVGSSDSDHRAIWNMIVAMISEERFEGQSFRFVSGFILGLTQSNRRDLVEELLEAALGIERLHATLVQMHCVADLGEAAVNRLIRAARLGTIPSYTFRYLGMGRSTDKLTGNQFRRLILAIANSPERLPSALDVMHMRIYSRRLDNKALSAEDKKAGVELLKRVAFTRGTKFEERHLSDIVKACLTPPHDEPIARELCERLRTAITRYDVYSFDYGKLVSSLAKKFPFTVLDVFVEKSREGNRRDLFSSFRLNRPNPLSEISDDDLMAWVKAGSAERYLKLAESIRPWTRHEEASQLSWAQAAIRLMKEAPDPIAVLERFAKKIRPSSWSGSFAEILEKRLPLLEALTNDGDTRIATWATAAAHNLKEEIEATRKWEQSHNRDLDERFEYDDD